LPNVDSALIVLRRTGPAPPPAVRALVRAAFAHRRKALAGSLELAAGSRELRARAREALEQLGHPAGERAERLRPEEFVELAERLR
jgi:16S rRNA (adenine1518-N6/adenine1519-N6)-dimethyltransferase